VIGANSNMDQQLPPIDSAALDRLINED